MTIAIAFFVAMQSVANTPADDEIVVIARRFEQAAVIVGKDAKGRFTCNLTASSGNSRLDERLCRTAANCVKKGAADEMSVRSCIERRKPGLFAQFRKEWKRGVK